MVGAAKTELETAVINSNRWRSRGSPMAQPIKMTSNGKNFSILSGVLLVTGIASIGYLQVAGSNDENLTLLLRLTARLSFMIYLVVFIARPLRQLVVSELSQWLLRERRSFGIAFAAVHSVHLGLIAWRYGTVPGLEYETINAIFGGTAYALMYMMLITSFDSTARALGPKAWRRLHKTGLYYIGLIFVATMLPEPGAPFITPERAWFVLLTAAAVFVRLTAYFASRKTRRDLSQR